MMEEKAEIKKQNLKSPESEEILGDSGAVPLRKRLWARVTRKGTIKLVSIGLSVILFSYVQYTSTLTRIVQVPVTEPEIPPELVFSHEIPPFLDVQFSGKGEKMDFDISGFRIVLENPNPLPGSNLYIVSLYPPPPKDVSAVYIKEIQLFIDRLFLRELSVIPKIILNLVKGHELGYVSRNPRTVVLKGPYETLAAMTHVETEELRVEEINDTISRRVLINNLPDFVSFAPNQPFQVELGINILPAGKENYKIIKEVPVRCINETPGIEMQVSGKSEVNFYMSSDAGKSTKEKMPAFVFCPVFFDEGKKSLRPSFLIQNQPVFSVDRLGLENAQILKIDPPLVNLQFKLIDKPKTPIE